MYLLTYTSFFFLMIISILITRAFKRNNIYFFEIQLRSDLYTWSVLHRFNDFYLFDKTIRSQHFILPYKLPSKLSFLPWLSTLLGPSYDYWAIEKRKKELQHYLRGIVEYQGRLFWKHPFVIEFFNVIEEGNRNRLGNRISINKETRICDDVLTSNPQNLNESESRISNPSEFNAASNPSRDQSQTQDDTNDTPIIDPSPISEEEKFETTVNSLHETVKVQKQISQSVKQEVETHNRLLDNINIKMDQTRKKLSHNQKKMNKI